MNHLTWRSFWAAVLCTVCVTSVWGATTFDDLKTSFAQYNKWIPPSSSQGIEGKISFFFKTHVSDSILLYQDDGNRDYLSVELLSAKVLLRFGVSGNSVRVQIGHDLADMLWHKLVIRLDNDRVILTLDQNLTRTATIPRLNEALLGNSTGILYIGGLPRSLSLSLLSSPQVAFKKRFVGCIKKIMMTNTENVFERAVLIKSKGTKSGCLNECRVRNPCLNNGKCVNRFSKAKCDCSGTGHEGKRCEKEMLRLHLSTADYLVYDMSDRPQATRQDHINIHFKTSKKNGLLLQTSFSQDYVTIKLSNGRIVVEWNLGSGKLELFIGNNLHDDLWHMIDVRRFRRNVKAILDGVDTKESICPPSHSTFNMNGGQSKVFVGGSQTVVEQDRFEGCLRKVVFGGVEFISKLKTNYPRFFVVGTKVWSCRVPATVSLTTVPVTTVPVTTVPVTTVPIVTRSTRLRGRKRNRQGRKRVSNGSNNKDKATVVIQLDTQAPKTTTPRVKTTETHSTKKRQKPSTCSPNDIRCVMKTQADVNSPRTKKPTEKAVIKSDPCRKFKNCTKGADNTASPDHPTGNASTTGTPKIQALNEATKEGGLGNIPTAIGLVVGSILSFLLCGFISYRYSKHREQKHRRAHNIKIEVRDEEEQRKDYDGFHQDVLVTN